jgi:hypothetical protein
MAFIDESKINNNLVKPIWEDYRCPKCNCNLFDLCRANWKDYSLDLNEYMILKFKDTYIDD